jgi:hypothetical protein
VALLKLDFKPGVNKEDTPYTAEGGWVSSDKVRFRSGRPEKMGGWQKYSNTQLIGCIRALHTTRTLDGTIYLAVGTTEKVYVENGGTFYDVTPIRETQALSGPFDTTAGSAVITVNDTAHGADDGAYVTISGAATTDGIPDTEINAEHQITLVDADTYTITVTTTATSGVTGGGGASISAEYQVNPGLCTATAAYGWGAGAWNAARAGGAGWNTAAATAGVSISPRFWNFTNWGEDIIMNYPGGAVYIWDATNPLAHATQITQAPHKVNHVTVTSDRHLVCFGCNAPGTANAATDLDTLNIRWCDQEDYTEWAVTSTNTAGDKLITNGTEIRSIADVESQVLIWTDDSVESMQFVGPPYTFAFAKVGTGSGIVSSRGWAAYNNVVYWMGDSAFYVFQGGSNVMPCTVQRYVFEGLSLAQRDKAFAVLNRDYNEITWFYPADSVAVRELNGAINSTATTINLNTTAALPNAGAVTVDSEIIEYTSKTDYSLVGCTRGARGTTATTHADAATATQSDGLWSDEPYHYVTYHVIDKIWWTGRLERSAMIDNGVLQYPVAAGTDGYLYNHEVGYDADGGPMVAFVQSGDFDIGEGDSLMHIHRAIPDFFLDGSVDLTMQTKYYPQASEVKETIGNVTPTTQKINTRIRARNMALRIESDDTGDYWKYGSVKIDQRTDGRR